MNPADTIEYLKRLEIKIDLLIEQKTKKELLNGWVEEKDIMAITGLSRTTLFKLRQEGHITRSTISGKKNYYKVDDFRKLIKQNEGAEK